MNQHLDNLEGSPEPEEEAEKAAWKTKYARVVRNLSNRLEGDVQEAVFDFQTLDNFFKYLKDRYDSNSQADAIQAAMRLTSLQYEDFDSAVAYINAHSLAHSKLTNVDPTLKFDERLRVIFLLNGLGPSWQGWRDARDMSHSVLEGEKAKAT